MQYNFSRRIPLVWHGETSYRAKCICSMPSACTYARVRSNKLPLEIKRPLLVSYTIYLSAMLPLGTKGNIYPVKMLWQSLPGGSSPSVHSGG